MKYFDDKNGFKKSIKRIAKELIKLEQEEENTITYAVIARDQIILTSVACFVS